MKDLTWDNSLSVQIDEIDDDHRKLVDLFNRLNHSVVDGDSIDYINAVLEELISCTVWHFRHEERLMIKHNYAGYIEHRDEHQDLIDSAVALQQKCIEEGRLISAEEIEFLERWLTGHILGIDMDLGTFLAEVM